jgi:mono/diheme cytochrome c family protein
MLKSALLAFVNAPGTAYVRARLRRVKHLQSLARGGTSLSRTGRLFLNNLPVPRRPRHVAGRLIAAVVLLCAGARAAPAQAGPGTPDAVERGEYVFHTAGGCSCHTDADNDGPRLAGGRAIDTAFGTFYSPNITPDPDTGIGGWNEENFVRALTLGIGPGGVHYYPAFPYTSFTRMSSRDLSDLWAYLSAQQPIKRADRPHDLWWPFSWRPLLTAWQWMFFRTGAVPADPSRSKQWNRGRYLVNGPAHCGECHTPRGWLGAADTSMTLAGTSDGPDGDLVPNITPDTETGIGRWQPADVAWLLQTGLLPDGDSVQGAMAEAIDGGYRYLSGEDRQAIAEYILSLPPIRHKVK